jgi:hypothetical protein
MVQKYEKITFARQKLTVNAKKVAVNRFFACKNVSKWPKSAAKKHRFKPKILSLAGLNACKSSKIKGQIKK